MRQSPWRLWCQIVPCLSIIHRACLTRSDCKGSSLLVSLLVASCCGIMASIHCVAGRKVCSAWVHASKRFSAVKDGVRVRHQLHGVHLPAAPGLRLCSPAKGAWLSSAGQLHQALLMCFPDCCVLIHDSLGVKLCVFVHPYVLLNCSGVEESLCISAIIMAATYGASLKLHDSVLMCSGLNFIVLPDLVLSGRFFPVLFLSFLQVKCGCQTWSYSVHLACCASLTLYCNPPGPAASCTAMSGRCSFSGTGCISPGTPVAFTACMQENKQQP